MDAAQAQEFIERLTGSHVGGWYLERCLGAGKSAVVMKGVQDGKDAAVKVFHRELVERFGREAQLARINRELALVGVEHPHVVKILGGGECQGSNELYVVMELLSWDNLREARSTIPAERIPNLVRQIAAAAEHLEGLGLAHRDIKPENIAISPCRNQVKLLDLGVIKPIGNSGFTDMTCRPFIGTLQYSSPEFLLREEDDSIESWRALTFYQIGAVLHDLIMQREIFWDRTEPFARLVQAILKDDPEVAGGDPRLVMLCKYCLIKDGVTRLRLVSWTSFNLTNDRAEDLARLQERLRVRREYEGAKAAGAGQALAGEDARLTRQLLDAACARLDFQIALTHKTSAAFPLCSSSPVVSTVDVTCSCLLSYEQDPSLGLNINMRIEVKLRLVDKNKGNPIFQLSGSCLHLSPPESDSQDVAIGSLSDILAEDTLGAWMLTALGRTYGYLDAN